MEKRDIYFNLAEEDSYVISNSHNHDGIEIYYITDGICNYFIGGDTYTVSAGCTVVIPEGVIHRTNYGSKKHVRYLLNIPARLISESIICELTKHGYLFDTVNDTIPLELFKKISSEYESYDTLSGELIASYASELLIHLTRSESESAIGKENSLIRRATEYVNDGYSKEISLSDIASRLGITPEHLSRKFKAETGFGFNEYLTLIRLQHAEHMLKKEPGRSVGEIAFAVGFNDSNYFSKRFREIYGVSPKNARKY